MGIQRQITKRLSPRGYGFWTQSNLSSNLDYVIYQPGDMAYINYLPDPQFLPLQNRMGKIQDPGIAFRMGFAYDWLSNNGCIYARICFYSLHWSVYPYGLQYCIALIILNLYKNSQLVGGSSNCFFGCALAFLGPSLFLTHFKSVFQYSYQDLFGCIGQSETFGFFVIEFYYPQAWYFLSLFRSLIFVIKISILYVVQIYS